MYDKQEENNKLLHILYVDEDVSIVENILSFVLHDDVDRVIQERECHKTIKLSTSLFTESAIVIISDNAVYNQNWQNELRSLNKSIRFITVGTTLKADYNDEKLIPLHIEEINSIPIDNKLIPSIKESLMLPSDFYKIKEEINANYSTWLTSYESDDFLIVGISKNYKFLKYLSMKLDAEEDEEYSLHLKQLINYVVLSYKASWKLFLKSLWRKLKIVILICFFVFVIYAYYNVSPYIKSLTKISPSVSFTEEDTDYSATAIKMMSAILNPLIDNQVFKQQCANKLIACLDKPWCNTPLAGDLSYRINDVLPIDGERFVWAAASNGNLLKIDTYTGKTVQDIKVCENELFQVKKIHYNNDFIVIDEYNTIYYVKDSCVENSITIEDNDNHYSICTNNNEKLIAYANNSLFLFSIENGNIISNQQIRNNKVFEIYFLNNEQFVICSIDNDCLILDVSSYEFEHIKEINVGLFNLNESIDIKNNTIVYVDSNNNVNVLDFENNNNKKLKIANTSKIISCSIINSNVIAYSDREYGVHLYDIEHNVDLGKCLSNTPVVNKIISSDSMIIGKLSNDYYCPQEISDFLPSKDWNLFSTRCLWTFSNNTAKSINGTIDNVSIDNEGKVIIEIKSNDGLKNCILYDYDKHMANPVEKFSYKEDINFIYDEYELDIGRPIYVGINNAGNAIIVISDSGYVCQYEIENEDSNDKYEVIKTSVKQIPTHGWINTVVEKEDYFFMQDNYGQYWKIADRTNLVKSYSGLKDAVKNKLHTAVSQELIEMLPAKNLIEELGIVVKDN